MCLHPCWEEIFHVARRLVCRFGAHLHVLGALLEERLGGEHVLDLGGADAEGERAKSTVGGSVRVAANNSGAREGEPLREGWTVSRGKQPVCGNE